jgi:hypothetical protein
MRVMGEHQVRPLDDDARAALDDPAYHAGLEQLDRDYELEDVGSLVPGALRRRLDLQPYGSLLGILLVGMAGLRNLEGDSDGRDHHL